MDDSFSHSSTSEKTSSSDSYTYDSDGSHQWSVKIGDKRYSKKAFKKIVYSDNPEDKEKIMSMVIDSIKDDNHEALESILCRITGYDISDILIEEKQQTALHIAYYHDAADTVNHILGDTSKKQIKRTDSNGLTYLHVGCWVDDEDLIKECIKDGVNINALFSDPRGNTRSGITPLHLASEHSSYSSQTVKLLLENAADINATDSLGRLPLHVACCTYGYLFDEKDPDRVFTRVDIMRVLLDKGSDVNQRDKNGNTPLLCIYRENYVFYHHWSRALSFGETVEKLKLLLERGADATVCNNHGDNVLHRLIRMKLYSSYTEPNAYKYIFDSASHIRMLEMILSTGKTVDINAKNLLGETPLQLAVSLMCANIVKVLLDHGADTSCLTFNQDDEYCFINAYEMPQLEQVYNIVNIAEILLDKGYNLTLEGNLMIMKFLIPNVKKCECGNVPYNEIPDFYGAFLVDSKIRLHLEQLMAFGSPNHFKYALRNLINFPSAEYHSDEKEKILLHVSHLVHLYKTANFFLEEEIINFVEKFEGGFEMSRNHLARIEREISLMQSMDLVDETSLYDIMRMHPHKVYQYIKDINFFDLKLRTTLFVYATIVEGRLAKSLTRHYVENSAYNYVTELSLVSLPNICLRNIFKYLSNEEILLVCLAAVRED